MSPPGEEGEKRKFFDTFRESQREDHTIDSEVEKCRRTIASGL